MKIDRKWIKSMRGIKMTRNWDRVKNDNEWLKYEQCDKGETEIEQNVVNRTWVKIDENWENGKNVW